MTTTVIIDAAVVIVLAIFTLLGAKKGLFRTLAGLVILALSMVGAGMLATTFAPPLTEMVRPVLEDFVSERVETAFAEQFEDLDLSGTELVLEMPDLGELEELLEQLGVDADELGILAQDIQINLSEGTDAARDAVLDVVLGPLVQALMYGIVYLAAFILLMVLLNILFGAMGLAAKLPGLRTLNTLGGGILGLAEGILLVFLGVWVARQLGVSLPSETLAETHILHMFTANSPLSGLSFLNH